MQAFNYGSYARAFELGVSKPNMTKIAKALFYPIVEAEDVVNRAQNYYVVDSKYAKAWYEQTQDIPVNIKMAAGRKDIVDGIGNYFAKKVLGVVTNQLQEAAMFAAMTALVRDSDLLQEQKDELFQYYEKDRAKFLGRAFLYAVIGDNTKKSPFVIEEPVEEDIRKFKELVKKSHQKPKALQPPKEIEDHELGYVRELYRVYQEISGEEYVRPEDLDGQPRLRKDFDKQRKDYYKAETIHRELRDTIRLDETASFDLLKDEMYEGVITTRDKDYNNGFDRMTAVMEHASIVPLPQNLQDRLLDWVGAAEKKGVCHMLVNDKRLSWMEDIDDEE